MATSTDIDLNELVINTMSQANYDQLSSAGQIRQNELYFVDDAKLDAHGKTVSNVASPELSGDAATKGYVDQRILSYKLPSDQSANLRDRAINQLSMNSDLSIHFPAATEGYARDFLLNLDYASGQLTIDDQIEKCGDDLQFSSGVNYLITFTEIGTRNSLPLFYVRNIILY